MINQFGNLFAGSANILGVIVAVILLAGLIYMLCRPYKEATKLSAKV
jgi:ferrous iron transport protein B